jgi:glutamate/tyrosine decarboxylase-like PLP-dependent enzyme
MQSNPQATLDPEDWNAVRQQGSHMLEDMLDYLEHIRQRPVWQPIPNELRASFDEPLPEKPADLLAIHETFMQRILPYAAGNAHPGFMGWVHGGGTVAGMLAEMLAAGLNSNLGGRDQIPLEIERQVTRWIQSLFGFPDSATGLFVTGTSMANLIGVLVARTAALGPEVRRHGVGRRGLVAYASESVHGSIAKAMDIAGLGTNALRTLPANERFEMDLAALEKAIEADRNDGMAPFLVVGTAGTVDVGAVDNLDGIAHIAKRTGLWFHVDGALGALAKLAPDIAPRLKGIEHADSVAFDFHKWGQVPYDAGFILVRDGTLHQETFSNESPYLTRGAAMAGGGPWPCDFGPDLSRGFRALKTWFTIKAYGAEKLGQVISQTCELAQYLKGRIEGTTELELLAPVALNIVCFRYRCADADLVNEKIVAQLQNSGICAPSTTTINGHLAIRAAIVNHRTRREDIDTLVETTCALGHLCAEERTSLVL